MRWLGIAGAVCVGILTAVQARLNGALGLALGDGLFAALISMVLALTIMIVLSLVVPNGRSGFRALVAGLRERSIPWWMVASGVAGRPTIDTFTATAIDSRIVPPMKFTSVAVSALPVRARSRPLVAACQAMPAPVTTGRISIHLSLIHI